MAIQTYELAYQVSPLILTGGVASQVPGSMMPFLAYANSAAFASLTTAGSLNVGLDSLDNAFGAFQVIQGGSLVKNSIAHYPFASQFVAANAIIREPLELSVIWQTPMRGPGAWATKLATMQALKATLDTHNNAGGTYTFVTPSYVYDNLVMIDLVDNSRPDSPLPQNAWRFDFERPLIQLQELQTVLNQLLNKLNGGLPTDGSQSGITPAVGQFASQPQSVAGQNSILPTTPNMSTGLPGSITGMNTTALSTATFDPFTGQPSRLTSPF